MRSSLFSRVKRVFWLATPIVFVMITQTIINQVDHVLVGHLSSKISIESVSCGKSHSCPSGQANQPQSLVSVQSNTADKTTHVSQATPGQSAVQLSQILLWMFGGFLASFSIGAQALIARRKGENELEQAGGVASNAMFLTLVASIMMAIWGWYYSAKLMSLISKDKAVLAYGIPFLQLRFANVPAMVLFAILKSFFDAIGKTWVPLLGAVIMNVVNLILCVALMYGTHPPGIIGIDSIHHVLVSFFSDKLPQLGVFGAGVAAMVSSYIGFFILLLCALYWGRAPYQIFHLKNISLTVLKKLMALSLPSGFSTLFGMSGFLFVFYVVAKLDAISGRAVGQTIYFTATSNVISVLFLVIMSCVAFGTATATLVSQEMGAKRFDEAKRYVSTSIGIGMIIYGIMAVFIFIYAKEILVFWNSEDAWVASVATPILRVMCLVFPFIVLATILTQALYGAGNARFVMLVELVLHFICLIPMSYLLSIVFDLGLYGAWAALITYVVAIGVVMLIKFRTGSWQNIKI